MNNENKKELLKNKEWNPKKIMLRSDLKITINNKNFTIGKNHKSSVNGGI